MASSSTLETNQKPKSRRMNNEQHHHYPAVLLAKRPKLLKTNKTFDQRMEPWYAVKKSSASTKGDGREGRNKRKPIVIFDSDSDNEEGEDNEKGGAPKRPWLARKALELYEGDRQCSAVKNSGGGDQQRCRRKANKGEFYCSQHNTQQKRKGGEVPIDTRCCFQNIRNHRCGRTVHLAYDYCLAHCWDLRQLQVDTPFAESKTKANNKKEKPRRFRGPERPNSLQCDYLNGAGQLCHNEAKDDDVFCQIHIGFPSRASLSLYKDYINNEEDETEKKGFAAGICSPCDSQENSNNIFTQPTAVTVRSTVAGRVLYDDDEEDDDGYETDSSEEEDDDEEHGHQTRIYSAEGPYTYGEFAYMWDHLQELNGEQFIDIEASNRVRGANIRMSKKDTKGQESAQYGRLLPSGMEKLIREILQLKKDDVFLDIGHGIGNTCIQVAFTVGCEARGIEVVAGRYDVSTVLRTQMKVLAKKYRYSGRMKVGEVILRKGELQDKEHLNFLTNGVTCAYANNFNGVFGERAGTKNSVFLDDYIAGLFTLMKPGSVMVTFHPIDLGLALEEANSVRRRHHLREGGDASFYDYDEIELGEAKDCVKWGKKESGCRDIIKLYKYTRLKQPNSNDAVFLCCNPKCENAKNGTLIKATKINNEGSALVNQCECRVTVKPPRRSL